MAFHYWFQIIIILFYFYFGCFWRHWTWPENPYFIKLEICFLLDELIYNVYSKFSHWKEEKKKNNNNNRIYSHFIIYSYSFVCRTIQLRGFITVDESSLSLMINVQTVHKYTIKERLSVCDCNYNFLAIFIELMPIHTLNLIGDMAFYISLNLHMIGSIYFIWKGVTGCDFKKKRSFHNIVCLFLMSLVKFIADNLLLDVSKRVCCFL